MRSRYPAGFADADDAKCGLVRYAEAVRDAAGAARHRRDARAAEPALGQGVGEEED